LCGREEAQTEVVKYSVSDKLQASQFVVEDFYHEVVPFIFAVTPIYLRNILLFAFIECGVFELSHTSRDILLQAVVEFLIYL